MKTIGAKFLIPILFPAALLPLLPRDAGAADWPQFRGPNAAGVSEENDLPVKFGPEEGLAWSTPLPAGISSPAVAGKRIYLTGLREKELFTIALERETGKVLWERRAPAEKIEDVHSTSSPAASSPASDGERAVVFFGSYGLLAYDPEGKELWRLPLGPFKNPFGEASSPIISGDLVLLNCDQDVGSFLLAADKATGKERWRTERPGFPRGFATPVVWEADGRRQVVVAGTLRVKGYALEDGRELWSQEGLARIVNPTPVVGQGFLFVSSFSPGGDMEARIAMASFEEYSKEHDADKDGRFIDAEIPPGDMKSRFLQLDADKDGFITREEWEGMARIFDAAKNSILALRPESPGKPGVAVAWRHEKAIPYVPSPLYYRGRIFLVKDGGIFTVLDAASGKVVKTGRLPSEGTYYSSPVAGGGNIYATSLAGDVTVLSAETLEVLSSAKLNESCAATPAIAGGRIYFRTERRLLAFAAVAPGKAEGSAR
jgi:outer membrane protein assembly factor BamB